MRRFWQKLLLHERVQLVGMVVCISASLIGLALHSTVGEKLGMLGLGLGIGVFLTGSYFEYKFDETREKLESALKERKWVD